MQQISWPRGSDHHAPQVRHSTSRVPGITRNSGWQAVDADIVRTRVTHLRTASGGDGLEASTH